MAALVTPLALLVLLDHTLTMVVTSEVHADNASPAPATSTTTEYCQFESFNASCGGGGGGAVVVMETARYGRMRLGRCLTTDYYVGCSADVLAHLDSRCSGKAACTVTVPDSTLFNVQPCRRDLMVYMEASYRCVQVSGLLPGGSPAPCSGPVPLTAASGHILTSLTAAGGLGSSKCPWVITARPGQKINITLLDFSTWSAQQPGAAARAQDDPGWSEDASWTSSSSSCPILAVLKDPGPSAAAAAADRSERGAGGTSGASGVEYLRVCSGGARRRVRHVLTSSAERLEVHVVNAAMGTFMLQYQAVGCPDRAPVPHAHQTRSGESLVVACDHSTDRWHLVCKGTTWIGGDVRNCSSGKSVLSEEQVSTTGEHFPFGLLIAIAIGVLIGVLCGFVFLMLAFVCRRRQRRCNRDTGSLLIDDKAGGGGAYKLVEVRHAGAVVGSGGACPGCQAEETHYGNKIAICDPLHMYDPHHYEQFNGGKHLLSTINHSTMTRCGDSHTSETHHDNSLDQPIPPPPSGPGGPGLCECGGSGDQPGDGCCCHACSHPGPEPPGESPYSADNWRPQDVYRSSTGGLGGGKRAVVANLTSRSRNRAEDILTANGLQRSADGLTAGQHELTNGQPGSADILIANVADQRSVQQGQPPLSADILTSTDLPPDVTQNNRRNSAVYGSLKAGGASAGHRTTPGPPEYKPVPSVGDTTGISSGGDLSFYAK